MIMRRLLALICCTLATQTAFAGKLKGANRRFLQTTRPPADKDGTPGPKGTPEVTPGPKETPMPKSSSPTASPKTPVPRTVASKSRPDDVYTWQSGDEGAHAVVSKSRHDEAMEKMKANNKMAESDDYGEPAPKGMDNTNRPPSGDEKGGYKGGSDDGAKDGSYDSKGSYNSKGGYKSGGGNKSGGYKSGGYKSGGYKSGGGNKGGGGKYSGDGGSYDGNSYDDMPVYSGGGEKGSSTKGSSYKSSSKGGSKGEKSDVPGRPSSPRPPQPGMESPPGAALTGVPVSRFALLYDIDHDLGMPMTTDYEDVHENTYLWLYTVMFRTFGDRMKNLLTDDTSNLYERDEPILIEYASVILFESDDDDIPSTADLDVLVTEAFTGSNGEAYVDGLQGLPRSNPFSSTTSATLQTVPSNQGRSVVGTIASRVSTKGVLPPFMVAAAFCVALAGGALAIRARNSRSDGKDSKAFDNFSRGEATAMTDDFTHSLGSMSEKTTRTSRRGWELELEANQPNLSPISEHQMDPDLAGWNDYFDSSNGSKDSDKSTDENSQYSIEDFVNEAERNLLGVRIRYPGQKSGDEPETSTALVPAPPSSLAPAPPSSLVPAPPSSIVSLPSTSLVPATPDEIDEASTQIEF